MTGMDIPATPTNVFLSRFARGSIRTMEKALQTASRTAGTVSTDALACCPASQLLQLRQDIAARFAPATANKIMCAVRGLARAAHALGLRADAPQIPHVRGSALRRARQVSPGELSAIIRTCRLGAQWTAWRDAALIAAMYAGGLRRAEVSALDLSALDIEQGTLRVLHGKGNKQRVVWLSEPATAAMRTWISQRGSAPGPLFLANRTGARLTAGAIYAAMRRRADLAMVPRFSPHDLRAAAASDMLDAGVDALTVQRILGHASPITTQRYDRRGDRAQAAAASRLFFPHVDPLEKSDLPKTD